MKNTGNQYSLLIVTMFAIALVLGHIIEFIKLLQLHTNPLVPIIIIVAIISTIIMYKKEKRNAIIKQQLQRQIIQQQEQQYIMNRERVVKHTWYTYAKYMNNIYDNIRKAYPELTNKDIDKIVNNNVDI